MKTSKEQRDAARGPAGDTVQRLDRRVGYGQQAVGLHGQAGRGRAGGFCVRATGPEEGGSAGAADRGAEQVSEEDDGERHIHITEGKCIHGLTWRGQFDGILADGLVDDMAHWEMLNDCAEKHGDLAVVDDITEAL